MLRPAAQAHAGLGSPARSPAHRKNGASVFVHDPDGIMIELRIPKAGI